MTLIKNSFCKMGHSVTGENVVFRAGGYTGKKYPNCKTCYIARRRNRLKKKYLDDMAYREKMKAKSRAYYHSHKIGAHLGAEHSVGNIAQRQRNQIDLP